MQTSILTVGKWTFYQKLLTNLMQSYSKISISFSTEIIHYYSFGIEKALDSTAIPSKRNNVGGIIIQDEEIILQRRNNRTMALPQE